jgi:hypothetical protein
MPSRNFNLNIKLQMSVDLKIIRYNNLIVDIKCNNRIMSMFMNQICGNKKNTKIQDDRKL